MAVENGNPVNATYTNSRLSSKTADNTLIGIQGLANGNPVSGAPIVNVQRAINETFDTVGMTGEGDVTANDYSSNNVIVDGDNRKEAIGKLDERFNESTGHSHTGLPGEGGLVSVKSLTNYNDLWTTWQSFGFTGATGSNVDPSTELAPKLAGGSETTVGVLTSPPENRVEITDTTGQDIDDGSGNKVYGRLTGTGASFDLDFFSSVAGVETTYSFGVATDILVLYRLVTDSANRPTVPSNPFEFGLIDLSGLLVDASPTESGIVNITSQVFGGAKAFQDALSAAGTFNVAEANETASGSAALLPAPTTVVVNLTNAGLFSIANIAYSSSGQTLILINKTGHEVILLDEGAGVPADQIKTGTGWPLVVGNDASVLMVRDATDLFWRVVGAPASSKTPIWTKYLVTHTDLQNASLTNFINIGTLEQKQVLQAVVIAPTTQVLGTGITSYSLSLGVTGETERFAPLHDYFGAVTGTSHRVFNLVDIPDFTASSSLRLTAVSEGANLDQTTAGAFAVYTLTSFIE
jgi:hypothetical protein